jgi:hypothetical protein
MTTELEQEVEVASRNVSTDEFAMSIGEIASLYRDGDLIINPNFQRFFRWDIRRKAKFIESILLRIPIPPIFVFKIDNGKWELIDGLQRLSTLLEFMGELPDPKTGGTKRPEPLVGTQYLPALDKVVWSPDTAGLFPEEDKVKTLPSPLQRAIKRGKLGIQILEKKSDISSKYDLFQRLDSGGALLNLEWVMRRVG